VKATAKDNNTVRYRTIGVLGGHCLGSRSMEPTYGTILGNTGHLVTLPYCYCENKKKKTSPDAKTEAGEIW